MEDRGPGNDEEGGRVMKDELRDPVTFQTMTISTPLGDSQSAFVGLGFACWWDEKPGLNVGWRDGKVEEVGAG